MALSEYEKQMWAEMEGDLRSSGFVDEQISKVEKPYRLKIVLGTLALIAGLVVMLVAVGSQIFLIALPGFGIMFAGAYLLIDGFIYNQRTSLVRPRNNAKFNDLWDKYKSR